MHSYLGFVQSQRSINKILTFGTVTKYTFAKCWLPQFISLAPLSLQGPTNYSCWNFCINLNVQLCRTLTCLTLFIFSVMEQFSIYTRCLNTNMVVGAMHLHRFNLKRCNNLYGYFSNYKHNIANQWRCILLSSVLSALPYPIMISGW